MKAVWESDAETPQNTVAILLHRMLGVGQDSTLSQAVDPGKNGNHGLRLSALIQIASLGDESGIALYREREDARPPLQANAGPKDVDLNCAGEPCAFCKAGLSLSSAAFSSVFRRDAEVLARCLDDNVPATWRAFSRREPAR